MILSIGRNLDGTWEALVNIRPGGKIWVTGFATYDSLKQELHLRGYSTRDTDSRNRLCGLTVKKSKAAKA